MILLAKKEAREHDIAEARERDIVAKKETRECDIAS